MNIAMKNEFIIINQQNIHESLIFDGSIIVTKDADFYIDVPASGEGYSVVADTFSGKEYYWLPDKEAVKELITNYQWDAPEDDEE